MLSEELDIAEVADLLEAVHAVVALGRRPAGHQPAVAIANSLIQRVEHLLGNLSLQSVAGEDQRRETGAGHIPRGSTSISIVEASLVDLDSFETDLWIRRRNHDGASLAAFLSF